MTVLLRQEVAEVKDMRPTDVPANQFAYHLGLLVSEGYIEKVDRGQYKLTSNGLKLAGSFSTKELRPQENMKTVIMLYGVASDGKIALFKWSRQPYINEITLPYDRMSYDASLSEALTTACYDKLGKLVDVTYRTNVFMTIRHEGQVISRMHVLVYDFNPADVTFPFKARNGQLFLTHYSDGTELMSGMDELLVALRNPVASEPGEFVLTY